jgi:hypothetical protein
VGSNYSPSKRRAEAMNQPLANYLGWTLIVICPACRDPKRVPVQKLLSRYAGDHKLMAIVARLRCSVPSCRRIPDSARLVGHPGGNGRPKQEVILVGPGAF